MSGEGLLNTEISLFDVVYRRQENRNGEYLPFLVGHLTWWTYRGNPKYTLPFGEDHPDDYA